MNKKITYLAAVVILVAGAGYWYYSQDRTADPGIPTSKTSQDVMKPETQKPATEGEPTSTTPATTQASSAITDEQLKQLPTIDDTWKTYASKQNDFSFKWPTRGRYAPTWDVKFADSDCVRPSDATEEGAVKNTLQLSGRSFCHVSFDGIAAGTTYLTDVYTTKVGSKYVAMTFSKKAYSAGALNCKDANEVPFSSSPSSCIPFDLAVYRAHLDQIVYTFTTTD